MKLRLSGLVTLLLRQASESTTTVYGAYPKTAMTIMAKHVTASCGFTILVQGKATYTFLLDLLEILDMIFYLEWDKGFDLCLYDVYRSDFNAFNSNILLVTSVTSLI